MFSSCLMWFLSDWKDPVSFSISEAKEPSRPSQPRTHALAHVFKQTDTVDNHQPTHTQTHSTNLINLTHTSFNTAADWPQGAASDAQRTRRLRSVCLVDTVKPRDARPRPARSVGRTLRTSLLNQGLPAPFPLVCQALLPCRRLSQTASTEITDTSMCE